jgi:pyridoxine kinase
MTGSLLNGEPLPEAVDRAVFFVNTGIRATLSLPNYNPLDGMDQERALRDLLAPLPTPLRELL